MICCYLLFKQTCTRGGTDEDRGAGEVGGAFGTGDDHGHRTVGLLATVEQSDARFSDPPGVLVIFKVNGVLVAPRGGVRRRVCPELYYSSTEVSACHAELVHITGGVQRHP